MSDKKFKHNFSTVRPMPITTKFSHGI